MKPPTENGSPPVSPAGSTPPVSPFAGKHDRPFLASLCSKSFDTITKTEYIHVRCSYHFRCVKRFTVSLEKRGPSVI